jgi:hypothetical protein
MKHKVSCLAALAGLFLGLAPQALAATIEITGPRLWSTLTITDQDDVEIKNGGSLIVNVTGGRARNITIGDATTTGRLLFASGANYSISVAQNVSFGGSAWRTS